MSTLSDELRMTGGRKATTSGDEDRPLSMPKICRTVRRKAAEPGSCVK